MRIFALTLSNRAEKKLKNRTLTREGFRISDHDSVETWYNYGPCLYDYEYAKISCPIPKNQKL